MYGPIVLTEVWFTTLGQIVDVVSCTVKISVLVKAIGVKEAIETAQTG